MENPGASLPELLVAANVQVLRQVHFHMQLMSLHQSPETTSDGRTTPASDSRFTLGHNKCRLHHGVARIQRTRLHHGRS